MHRRLALLVTGSLIREGAALAGLASKLVAACAMAAALAVVTDAWGQSPVATAPAAEFRADAPMTSVGLRLPLRYFEMLTSIPGGCAMLSPRGGWISSWDGFWAASQHPIQWLGACRFGLADGEGMLFYSESGARRARFRYGIELATSDFRQGAMGGPPVVSPIGIFWSPDRAEAIEFVDWKLPADEQLTYDRPGGLSQRLRRRSLIVLHARNPIVMSLYHQEVIDCPSRGVPGKRAGFFARDELARLTSICRSGRAQPNAVIYERIDLPDPGPGAVFASTSNPAGTGHGHICAASNDCGAAWNAATAPQKPEIDRLMAELRPALEATVADMEVRMRPLEQAMQAKLRSLAANRKVAP